MREDNNTQEIQEEETMTEDFNIFIVDKSDEVSEKPEEEQEALDKANEEWMKENVYSLIEKVSKSRCECGYKPDEEKKMKAVSVDYNGQMYMTDATAKDVEPGGFVAVPMDGESEGSGTGYNFRAVILADDDHYEELIMLIRQCPECKKLEFFGDIDWSAKVYGFDSVKILDYEQDMARAAAFAEEEVEAEAEPIEVEEAPEEECTGDCEHCDSCVGEKVLEVEEEEEVVEESETVEEEENEDVLRRAPEEAISKEALDKIREATQRLKEADEKKRKEQGE